jgi:hypothetical protein
MAQHHRGMGGKPCHSERRTLGAPANESLVRGVSGAKNLLLKHRNGKARNPTRPKRKSAPKAFTFGADLDQ